jgi:hypothetical protein
MIIEGEWKRVDTSTPKPKSEWQTPKVKEESLTEALEAYYKRVEKAATVRSKVVREQGKAFDKKMTELQEQLRERELKG